MLDLSVEALKVLMYLQKDLLKVASKSNFLSICLWSKGFKVHIQVKQMNSSQVSNNYHFNYYYQFIFSWSLNDYSAKKTNKNQLQNIKNAIYNKFFIDWWIIIIVKKKKKLGAQTVPNKTNS